MTGQSILPNELGLARDERLIWTGQPRRGFRFTLIDVPITLFMLFWAGLPLHAAWDGLSGDGHFDLFLLPFLCVGLYMLIGRFFVDAYLRSQTRYALTASRAIIQRSGLFPAMRSVLLVGIPDLRLAKKADGSGTIRFGTGGFSLWNRGGYNLVGMPGAEPGFIGIDDVDRVYDLIVRGQNGAL